MSKKKRWISMTNNDMGKFELRCMNMYTISLTVKELDHKMNFIANLPSMLRRDCSIAFDNGMTFSRPSSFSEIEEIIKPITSLSLIVVKLFMAVWYPIQIIFLFSRICECFSLKTSAKSNVWNTYCGIFYLHLGLGRINNQ